MNYKDKENIINSLAAHMGVVNRNTKANESRYDATTGTLYCNGMTLPHSSLENIQAWFKEQMLTYQEMSMRNSEVKEMYMRFAVAYNAILLLKDNVNN